MSFVRQLADTANVAAMLRNRGRANGAAGSREYAAIEIVRGDEKNAKGTKLLLNAPGATSLAGDFSLSIDGAPVRAKVLGTVTAANGKWVLAQAAGMQLAAAGTAVVVLTKYILPILEQNGIHIPPSVVTMLQAVLGTGVMFPLYKGVTPLQMLSESANDAVDGHLMQEVAAKQVTNIAR